MYNKDEAKKVASISIRDVDKDTWRNFKKLACIHDMSIQDYLKVLVEKEISKTIIKLESYDN